MTSPVVLVAHHPQHIELVEQVREKLPKGFILVPVANLPDALAQINDPTYTGVFVYGLPFDNNDPQSGLNLISEAKSKNLPCVAYVTSGEQARQAQELGARETTQDSRLTTLAGMIEAHCLQF